MLRYAKIVDEERKLCIVGLGTDEAYYKSEGFVLLDVEKAYDGQWYLKESCPEIDIEFLTEEVKEERDRLLRESDWTVLPDSPLPPEKIYEWKAYRQALRDVPQQAGFPTFVIIPDPPV